MTAGELPGLELEVVELGAFVDAAELDPPLEPPPDAMPWVAEAELRAGADATVRRALGMRIGAEGVSRAELRRDARTLLASSPGGELDTADLELAGALILLAGCAP